MAILCSFDSFLQESWTSPSYHFTPQSAKLRPAKKPIRVKEIGSAIGRTVLSISFIRMGFLLVDARLIERINEGAVPCIRNALRFCAKP